MVMIDFTKDIQSLTTFRRNSAGLMKHLKKSQRPMVLTVNGKAEMIVQDTKSYQRLLDIAAKAEVDESLQQAMQELKLGLDRDFNEFAAEFKRKNGISR